MDTEVKNKNSKVWVTVAVVIFIVVASFIYLRKSQNNQVISNEFVLEKTTQSGYDENTKTDFKEFESDKSLTELVETYRNTLKEKGWNIEVDKSILEISHRLFASKGDYKVNIFISEVGSPSGETKLPNKRTVQIHYLYAWPSIEYNKNDLPK